MSNFLEFYTLNQGMPDTAQRIYVASTNDTLNVATAANYLNDKVYTTNNSVADTYIYNGPLQANDILFLAYDLDGTPGFTVGYVDAVSETEFNFVVGIQGLTIPSVPKKIVKGATDAGAGATITITDADVLTTDVIVVSVDSMTTPESMLSYTAGNGSFTVTFAGAPGASVIDYIVYASV